MAENVFRELALGSVECQERAPLGARLPRFMGLAGDGPAALQGLKLAVIGCGAVGREFALHAARLQPEALWLCDRGRYKAESLLTQPIHPDEVGSAKALATARRCKVLSPGTRVFAFDSPVEALPPTAFAGADLVALASDNLRAEVEVGQRCLRLSVPLVQASVHGDALVAQVRFFLNRGGPCPACGFNSAEWAHLNQETTFSCAGAPATTTAQPTRSVSFLCAIAANLAWVQVLRHTLRLGMPVGDHLLEYCGYTHRTVLAPLVRSPECPCDHTPWERAALPQPLADCTLAGLLQRAGGHSSGLERVSFAVGGLPFAEHLRCRGCRRLRPGGRFVQPGRPAGMCPHCDNALEGEPFYRHDPVPAAVVAGEMSKPLWALGAGEAEWAIVRCGERAVLFLPPARSEPCI